MLGVLPNSAPDCIDEGLGLAQALTKKSVKFFPGDGDIYLVLYLALVLLPAEEGSIFWEGSCKRNSVWFHSTNGGKVVFALLEEIITLHMGLTQIHVWEPCFQKLLTWAFIMRSGSNNRSQNRCKSRRKKRSGFKDGPGNPLEVIFQIPNNGGVSGARRNKRSNNRCK